MTTIESKAERARVWLLASVSANLREDAEAAIADLRSDLTDTGPVWAVQWIDPDDPEADGPVIESQDGREAAERIAAGFHDAHLRTAQTWRGPWTEAGA